MMDPLDEQTLQITGTLAENVRLPGISSCPHCHQGFGRASLPIHVGRCRALLPPVSGEERDLNPIKKYVVHSLVDLCLRFVTKHFKSACMDRIVAFPEAEAALIASLPSNLLHRMIVNLVKENKRIDAKNQKSRAAIVTLESALQEANCNVKQLESARTSAARSRVRIAEQQHISEQLQRELDTLTNSLALAESENQRLHAKVTCAEKKILSFKAKVNTLEAAKGALEKVSTEAQRREIEATRQLVIARKTPSASMGLDNSRRRSKQRQNSAQRLGSSSCASQKSVNSGTIDIGTLVYHARPNAAGSKIPYPSFLHQATARR